MYRSLHIAEWVILEVCQLTTGDLPQLMLHGTEKFLRWTLPQFLTNSIIFFIWDTNWPSTFIKGTFFYPLLWSAILAINQMSTGVNLFLDSVFSSICLSSQNVTCYNYSIFNSWFLVVEATKFILSDCLGNFWFFEFSYNCRISLCRGLSHLYWTVPYIVFHVNGIFKF